MMGIKDKRNIINQQSEKKYPGIKDYYLRCVSDEIVDTIRRETLEDTYFLSTSDIQKIYDIDKKELMHVIALLDMEPTLKRNKFHVGRNVIEFKVFNNNEISRISERVDEEFSDFYDFKKHAVKIFGRCDFPGLVYSIKQGRKMITDIFIMMNESDKNMNRKELIRNYIRDRNELSMQEEKQNDGTSVITLKENNEVLLKGSLEDVAKALGISMKDIAGKYNKEGYIKSVEQRYEKLKKDQMEGIIEERKNHFIEIRNIDESKIDPDWFDEEEKTIELWNKRNSIDESFNDRQTLNGEDIRWIEKETDKQLGIAYKLKQEKVMVR